MLIFAISRELMLENLNLIESENGMLRDQIEDMERELDFKERKITELEAELKIFRNERENFVEMGVRLEIQTKELGMMTRDLKA